MNIVFFHMNTVIPPYIATCVTSIRQFMPHARVIHLTDYDTPECPGVDEVRRYHSPFVTNPVNLHTVCYAGCYYLATCGIPEMVYIDPDMLFAGDISPLVTEDFDVTVAARPAKDRVSNAYRNLYPYNSFIITHHPEFWPDVYARMLRFRSKNWARNMEAVGNVVNSGKYRVNILDGDIYNARPKQYNPLVKVYHFRIGERKNTYMPQFYHQYIEGTDGH